jgi:hypothetical protein
MPYRPQLVTLEDLQRFRIELLIEIKKLLKEHTVKAEKKWMKTKDIRKFLGVSQGTLQTLRVNGSLPYTKIGGVYYYDFDDVQAMLCDKKFVNRQN